MLSTTGLVNYHNQNSTASYQGDYAEKEKIGSTNAFELRLYDARIGRWMTTDPYGQYHSPYLSMGNDPISRVDPDGGEDVIYLDADGNEIDRIEMEGDDIYVQETYSGDIVNGLNVGSFEKISLLETKALFEGQKVPGKWRIDGSLRLIQTFSNGLERGLDTWPALSGSRRLLPVPNGDDWQLSGFHFRDGRVNRQYSKGHTQRIWLNDRMTRSGVGFSVNINPDPRYGREFLRVHPDAPPIGTAGCIGLTCGADRLTAFENAIKKALDCHGGSIPLEVRGSYNGSKGGWGNPIIRSHN